MGEITIFRTIAKWIDPALFVDRTEPLDVEIIPSTSGRIPLTNIVEGNTLTREFEIVSYKLKTLRLYVDITSLSSLAPIVPTIEDSDINITLKNQEQEINNPAYGCQFCMFLNGQRIPLCTLRLQNRRPGYFVNLYRYLTDREEFDLSKNASFSLRFYDVGDGFPAPTDVITALGEVADVSYSLDSSSDSSGISSQLQVSLSGAIALTGTGGTGGTGGDNGEPPPALTTKFRVTYSNNSPSATCYVYFASSFNPEGVLDLASYMPNSYTVYSGDVLNFDYLLTQPGSYLVCFIDPASQSSFLPYATADYVNFAPVGQVHQFQVTAKDTARDILQEQPILMLTVDSLPASIEFLIGE